MDWNDSIDLTGQDDLDASQVVGWQDKQANYSFHQSDISLDETLESSFTVDEQPEQADFASKPNQIPKMYNKLSNLKAVLTNTNGPFIGQNFILQLPFSDASGHTVPTEEAAIDLTETQSDLNRSVSPILSRTQFNKAATQVLIDPTCSPTVIASPPSPILSQPLLFDPIIPIVTSVDPSYPQPVDVKYIGGVKVELPVKAYPSQISIMFKLITGISKRQHCLLESPTGTGKTLALLCGALAWQKHEKERIQKQEAASRVAQTSPSKAVAAETSKFEEPSLACKPPVETSSQPAAAVEITKNTIEKRTIYYDSDEDCSEDSMDFCPKSMKTFPSKQPNPAADNRSSVFGEDDLPQVHIHKRPRISPHQSPAKIAPVCTTPPKNAASRSSMNTSTKMEGIIECTTDSPEKLKLPKIYYGTRTHKQLQQVIREFKKTAYSRDIRMTVLSSREQSCVNTCEPGVHRNKDELCHELLDKKIKSKDSGPPKTGCDFFNNKHRLHHNVLPSVWDIEELCDVAVEINACAYFAAKSMVSSADIIFCPYNYIIDPNIRNSMSLELEDSIVILDEAHNIEDKCRDAASINIDQAEINAAKSDITNILNTYFDYNLKEAYESIKITLGLWSDWFDNNAPMMAKKSEFESIHVFEGVDLVQSFNCHRIGSLHFKGFQEAVQAIVESMKQLMGRGRFDSQETKSMGMHLSTISMNLLEKMVFILPFLYSIDCEDFLGALKRKSEFGVSQSQAGSWLSKKNPAGSSELSLSIWCMNPALIFSALKNARCIALSSGTLSPAETLPGELATNFPLTVFGNHVIPKERVWVGALSYGPKNIPLECTFRNNSRLDFQDSVGAVLLWVCKNTPHGVLCFVPSYKLMENLQARWMSTGLWSRLKEVKSVYLEARNGRDHNETMNKFYTCVETESGALLFAVFRGKVSEGMDFRDHQARAVISIGIPYPNSHDEIISRKMKYNDKHRLSKQLLSGSDWLQIQAYRALNQALGRCVRHAGDWGAVLLIDSRFANERYTRHISKWVRSFMSNQMHTWDSLTKGPNSLDKFMRCMTLTEPDTRQNIDTN